MAGDSVSKSSSKRNLYIAIIAAVVIVSVVAVIRYSDVFAPPSPYPGVGKSGSDHQHARFKVYLEGKPVDFGETPYYKANEYIFLEEKDGNTIHRFATGATLEMFFENLGMKFNGNCFILDESNNDGRYDKNSFCVDEENKMLFYVNNEPNDLYEKYVINEGDKVLIAYGKYDEQDIRIMLRTIGTIPTVPGIP